MSNIRWYGPTIVLLLTVAAVMVLGPRTVRQLAQEYQDEKINVIRADLSDDVTLAELSESFRKVRMVVGPSVVHLEVLKKPGSHHFRRRLRLLPDDDGGDEDDDLSDFNPTRPVANGSGWVYDTAGHVVTNYHVISDADEIIVRFYDGSEVNAEVVGVDERTDVAVLKVASDALHPAVRATESVEQGDIVFAFGSPFKFDFSMSHGIVSATHRRNLGILVGGYEDFIQTDAAINPGNSGGPLTNIRGEVIGMNTAIASAGTTNSQEASFSGLGFAIPVEMIAFVVDQMIETGEVKRGYLNVVINDLTPEMSRTFGFKGAGVLVDLPLEEGPAFAAGMRRGDIITKVNGERISSVAELRSVISQYPPQSELSVELFSAGTAKVIKPVISELPDEPGIRKRPIPLAGMPMAEAPRELKVLGIEAVSELTPERASAAGVSVAGGVMVRVLRPNSLAATPDRLELKRNNGLPALPLIPLDSVITHVMDQPVTKVDELVAELGKHSLSKGIRLSLYDSGMPRFVLVRIRGEE